MVHPVAVLAVTVHKHCFSKISVINFVEGKWRPISGSSYDLAHKR